MSNLSQKVKVLRNILITQLKGVYTFFKISHNGILLATLITFVAIFVVAFGSNASDTKVKVVPSPVSLDNVGVVDIPSGTTISQPATIPQCVTQQFLDTYFHGSADEYNASFSQMVKCLSGGMEATVLNTQISGIQDSINMIDNQLLRLGKTADYLKSFSKDNLNNISVTVIPAGEISQKANRLASGITAQCLINFGETTGGVYGVGTLGNFNSSFFDLTPPSALTALKTLIEDQKKIKRIIGAGITSNDWSRLLNLAKIVVADENIMFGQFIPVTSVNPAEKNFAYIGLTWTNDKRTLHKLSWGLRKLASVFIPDVPKESTDMSISVGVSLNGMVNGVLDQESVGNTFTYAWVPENMIFEKIQASIAAHTKAYEAMKSSLQDQKAVLTGQLDTIIANGYYCQ